MILCGCTTEVDGIVARGGYRHPPPPPRRKAGGGWRREERVKKIRVAYVTNNDGT